MSWSKAQIYCRRYHTDLASSRDKTEESVLKALTFGNTWFGLFRDSWKWADQTNFSTFNSMGLQHRILQLKVKSSEDVNDPAVMEAILDKLECRIPDEASIDLRLRHTNRRTAVHPDHLTHPLLCQWRDGQMVPEGTAGAHTRICMLSVELHLEKEERVRQQERINKTKYVSNIHCVDKSIETPESHHLSTLSSSEHLHKGICMDQEGPKTQPGTLGIREQNE
ncbi:hypothetical protein Baya_16241 [Bagarius yarrelli]|uniref:C-type lectin domain-containing protein n=1 Tax=Bagarius yarrelli TaxID=175774 RepID=A0A556VV48_BAGYA|nr:hypothetical protein Baya_16241 [Bagarius yarrelli]